MATKVYKRRKLISSSSSIYNDEDLVIEILIRLPHPRLAYRCKSVCKRWNAIISAPYFPRRLVSHHQTLSASTGESERPVWSLSQVRELILSFLPFPRELRSEFSVLSCDRDLLLLGFRREDKNDQELRRTHLICNPFTKQWVALPLSPKMSVRNSPCRWIVKLVCQPLNPLGLDLGDGQAFPCDFGYRRFLVVRMFDSPPGSLQAEVFCSRSGGWRQLNLYLDCHLRSCFESHVVKWDLFRLRNGSRPTLIDGSWLRGYWSFWSASEDAVHAICENSEGVSVWRLDEGGRGRGGGWKKQYEVRGFENLWCSSGRVRDGCETEMLNWKFERLIGLQPGKPESMLLGCSHPYSGKSAILAWDFMKKELEFLTYQDDFTYPEGIIYQSKVAFWPSPIPNYEKLRNTYDGRYDCWLPPNNR